MTKPLQAFGKSQLKTLFALLFVTIFVYTPMIAKPSLLLSRGNDLEEVFWPVFYFIRQKFWETGTLPFWNNLFFSGTPLLPDPQFSLFYPPNWLFILLPTDYAFFFWLILHSAFGGWGFYLVLTRVFKISSLISLIGSILYITTPSVANFLEAGHIGLIGSYTWVPYLLLSAYKLVIEKNRAWLLLGSISLSGLFYTHTIIFLISLSSILLFSLTTSVLSKSRNPLKALKVTLAIILLAFLLSAITFLPQLSWSKTTTRFLLLENREIYPVWKGLKDFLFGITPWILGKNEIWSTETEKWIVVGPIMIMLSSAGFFTVSKKIRIVILAMATLILLIISNNISIISGFLSSLDLFVLTRISTRIWYIAEITIIVLACVCLQKALQKGKKIFYLLATLAIAESLVIFWIRVEKPVLLDGRFAPSEVYEYLAQDQDLFRVFCTTRCLSQKQSAIYNLQLVEGYNTLQQTNYFKHMWQITGKYWNYYTLAVPPPGIYKFEEIHPDAKSLGEYNAKYIISPYKIEDNNLVQNKVFGGYYIYLNNLYKPRVYTDQENTLPIINFFSPNYIKVTVSPNTKKVILSEIFSTGWKAYIDNKEVPIQETPNALRLVDTKPQDSSVIFVYRPTSFLVAATTTALTWLSLATLIFIKRKPGLSTKLLGYIKSLKKR